LLRFRDDVGRFLEARSMTDAAKPKGASLVVPKERLLRMRDEELARMTRQGQLWRISVIDAALAVLDEAPTEWEPASRAVVSDGGQTVRLTLCAETGAVVAVELDPTRAVALAGELIEAALARLNGD
jgi:hypothetical protein